MRDSRPLSVDVSELLRQPGANIRVRTTSRLDGLGVPLAWVEEGSDLAIDLSLDALVDGIHVTGDVTARYATDCRRCLRRTTGSARRAVAEVVAYPGDERDDAYALDGEAIDLEPLIRDVVVGDLPFAPLCRPDCAGLCPLCGADRNEADCGHDTRKTDARWAPLHDLQRRLRTTDDPEA